MNYFVLVTSSVVIFLSTTTYTLHLCFKMALQSSRSFKTANKGRVPTGYAEEVVLSDVTYREAHRIEESRAGALTTSQPQALAGKKRKREGKGDSAEVYGTNAYKGPWAKFEVSEPESEASSYEYVTDNGTDDEEEKEKEPLPKMATDYAPAEVGETSEFLGSEQFDYQGRTYMHIPQDLDIDLKGDLGDDYKNYTPKKSIFTWNELKGAAITQMRFFPGSGHLLLASNANGKIMLYDMYRHNREALRSYNGHNKSVSGLCFNPDGTSFLDASYDRKMKLWDTETGQCKGKFGTKATPHVVHFNPSIPHEFIAGMGDKKIVQFDIRSGEVVQEYDHHLGPVNTLEFCDENRRFVSTSDDRSLRAWEYGIPVPIKYISEPEMYSLTRSCAHPRKDFVLYQSADNQIVVYGVGEKFRQNRKKSFRGHNNSGYAIDVSMSPDGEIVASGDTGGYVCFWSWKTCKMMHKIQASETPVISVQYHPRETSKVVTGDLNGIIKYWD